MPITSAGVLTTPGLTDTLFQEGCSHDPDRLRKIGGLDQQRAQLNRCVLASRQAHPNERPRDALARLMVEVPACMNVAGYEQVVTNMSCSRTAWQGDVFCYVPKSYLGKLIYRLDAARVARLQFEAVPRSKAGGV